MIRVSTALVLVAGIAGCRGPLLSPEDALDIEGSWSYIENSSDGDTNATCTAVGTLSFVQDGAIFDGSFSRTVNCSGVLQGASLVASTSGRVREGKVQDETIQFEIERCLYRGVVADPDRLSGSVLCSQLNVDASVTVTSGNWQADRLTDR